jgi:hypothetical protein
VNNMKTEMMPDKMSFKTFLRDVIGGAIPSAKTETDRMRHLREFLRWWNSMTLREEAGFVSMIRSATPPAMFTEGWTPENIIQEKRMSGFSPDDVCVWTSFFELYDGGRLNRRAQKAATARWKKAPEHKKELAPSLKRRK